MVRLVRAWARSPVVKLKVMMCFHHCFHVEALLGSSETGKRGKAGAKENVGEAEVPQLVAKFDVT